MRIVEKIKCHKIIHTASISGGAIAAAMAQIPGGDVPILIGIEVTMVISLGAVFGVSISETSAKGIIASTTAYIVGRGTSQALVGWIPAYGNVINSATAITLIEVVGWAVAHDFSNNENRDRPY